MVSLNTSVYIDSFAELPNAYKSAADSFREHYAAVTNGNRLTSYTELRITLTHVEYTYVDWDNAKTIRAHFRVEVAA